MRGDIGAGGLADLRVLVSMMGFKATEKRNPKTWRRKGAGAAYMLTWPSGALWQSEEKHRKTPLSWSVGDMVMLSHSHEP